MDKSSIDVDVFFRIVADTSLAEKESRDEKEQSGLKKLKITTIRRRNSSWKSKGGSLGF
jgi:hypothetical protein